MEKKDRISVANIISVIGLAGIGMVTFFGIYLGSGKGNFTMAILLALLLVAGLAGTVIMATKAKTATEHLRGWRIVEYVCLAAYIAFAAIFAGRLLGFFKIASEKDQLKQQAITEIEAIENLYASYDTQRTNHITFAVEQLTNYKHSHPTVQDSLYNLAYGPCADLETWRNDIAEECTKLTDRIDLNTVREQINKWDIFQLPAIATMLEQSSVTVPMAINNTIASYGAEYGLIPVISGGAGEPYRLEPQLAAFDIPALPQSTFATQLHNTSGSTPLGWILLVVMHLAVLLSYLLPRRSGIVNPNGKSGRTAGGMDL